jgi:hypothetical protein
MYFELIFSQGEKQGSFQSSACGYLVFPTAFVEEDVF